MFGMCFLCFPWGHRPLFFKSISVFSFHKGRRGGGSCSLFLGEILQIPRVSQSCHGGKCSAILSLFLWIHREYLVESLVGFVDNFIQVPASPRHTQAMETHAEDAHLLFGYMQRKCECQRFLRSGWPRSDMSHSSLRHKHTRICVCSHTGSLVHVTNNRVDLLHTTQGFNF